MEEDDERLSKSSSISSSSISSYVVRRPQEDGPIGEVPSNISSSCSSSSMPSSPSIDRRRRRRHHRVGTNYWFRVVHESFLERRASMKHSLLVLRYDSPPELMKAYVLKFLDSYSYFSFSLIFTTFLSDEFRMTDVQAGTVYGAWGALITMYGLVTGTIIDKFGVARCLRVGYALSLASRVMLFVATGRRALLLTLLLTLPLGNCLGIPVLTVGIRRYTRVSNRGFAFGLYYVIMNVGALVAGPMVDAFTSHYNRNHRHRRDEYPDEGEHALGEEEVDDEQIAPWTMTANRAIILSGVFANLIAVAIVSTVREIKVNSIDDDCADGGGGGGGSGDGGGGGGGGHDPMYKSCEVGREAFDAYDGRNDDADDGDGGLDDGRNARSSCRVSPPNNSGVSNFKPTGGSSLQILSETLRTPNFRRFLVVCLLTINVRMVFRHL